MTSAARESNAQREVGKYHLVAELARGGMGNVYLAVTQGPGGFHKIVVLKELKPELSRDETYTAMFLDEARLAARLTHPNIVQTYEVGSDDASHYMVMEFLDGRSLYRLSRHFAHSNLLPIGAHLRIIGEALLGLEYAHDLRGFDGEPIGIVHRDVSPLNIVVTFEGQTKILDFGIAKAVDSSLETRAGILKGRVAYMAPEQARGGKVDRRADVYSAGVLIWEAAARRRLWPDMSEVEILTRMLGQGPPSLRSVVASAPADLSAICARAMAPAPDDRYPSAAALFRDLDAHLARRSDTMTMRAIGALMSQTFREERQKTNEAIEETLVRIRGGSRSGVMPVLQNPIADTRATDSRDLMVDMGSLSSIPAPTPSYGVSGIARAGQARSFIGDALSSALTKAPWGASRNLAMFAMAGALGAAAVAAVIAHHAESNAPPALAAAAPKPATPAASALEDAPVRVPPPTDPTPADEVISTHSLFRAPRVEPPHHAVAVPPKHSPSAPEPQPSVASPSRAEIDPAGGRPPLRPIVTSNPYGVP